jgi:hypothetical protein
MNQVFARGMRSVLWWAASLLIGNFTEKALTRDRIDRVKNLIVELAHREIDKSIKHATAAEIIRGFVPGLADTLVDWVIRTILWVARLAGDIDPDREQQA